MNFLNALSQMPIVSTMEEVRRERGRERKRERGSRERENVVSSGERGKITF
jgi:hypothetical protein